jgi:thiol:disulfide interchange protein
MRRGLLLALAWSACALNEPGSSGPSGGRSDTQAAAAQPWGGGAIAWKSAADGLAAAKAAGKRALVVVSAEWCGHCRNYARVFSDPRVVDKARSFEMIRLDADRDPMAARFAVDGGYVPRTFFLRPDGTIDTEIHAARAQYRYFYDEHDPGPLLAAMSRALAR